MSIKHIRPFWIFATLAFITVLFAAHNLFLEQALAHGPTGSSKIRVNNETIGPYNLLVATSPEPITTGSLDIWVRVADNTTDTLLRDTTVMVEAAPRSGGPTLTAQATHEHAGNAFDYVAHLEIEDSGQWDFTIYVEDQAGQVDVTFSDVVRGGSPTNLIIALSVFLVVVVLAVGLFLARQSKGMSEQNNLATG